MDARRRAQPKRKGLIAQLGDFLRWMLLLALVTITFTSLGLYFVHSQLDEKIRLYVENKFQAHYPDWSYAYDLPRIVREILEAIEARLQR